MFFLNGFHQNLETIISISKYTSSNQCFNNTASLKTAYIKTLKKIQPNTWQNHSFSKNIYDHKIIESLLSSFSQQESFSKENIHKSRLEYTEKASMKASLSRIDSALSQLKVKAPQIYDLFFLVVNTLFYWRSVNQSGGSTSNAIGVIWVSNRKNWNLWDTIEFLVHEVTHQLMFLDELRFIHYKNYTEINDPEKFSLSAILCKPRPMDKVIHSLVVGFEILSLRQHLNTSEYSFSLHPGYNKLKEDCIETIDSINSTNKKHNLLTAKSLEIIEKINFQLKGL